MSFYRSTGEDADCLGGVKRFAAPCCPEVQPLLIGTSAASLRPLDQPERPLTMLATPKLKCPESPTCRGRKKRH
eukprot:7236266-Pyramimonas_sp.AAC.1